MHVALKDPLYKEAKKALTDGGKLFVWTSDVGYMTDEYAIEITSIEELKVMFKNSFDNGWPIGRIEVKYPINKNL